MKSMNSLLRCAWIMFFAWVFLFQQVGHAATPSGLADYVARPDDGFKWELKNTREIAGAKLYEIHLTSQIWQEIPWTHDLVVIVPPKTEPKATMFLYNQGGKPGANSLLMGLEMAKKMRAPVAFLYGIPKQPLFGKLTEDALIAETFVRFLKTGDSSWPLLFPMVKSLVKSMDALQAFAKKEWNKEITHFVVSGASKRGWTTWLTAASDPRVKAIIPMVIDTLNMRKQMPYQVESYGTYSDQIADYTKRNLVPVPKTPEAEQLWAMVDPWVYREKIKMPKLIMNGANDPYWTQDALNLYWDDLQGDKWICYVPNAGHGLEQKEENGKVNRSRALDTISSFAAAFIHDLPLPKMAWKHKTDGTDNEVLVTSDIRPKTARLWYADSNTRDFRKSTWKETPAQIGKEFISAKIENPKEGCRVFFLECEYEKEGMNCYLSTQVKIVGNPKK